MSGRDVKCCLSAKVYAEDGTLKDFSKEKAPILRSQGDSSTLSGLCKCVKFLTRQGALLMQVRRRETFEHSIFASNTKSLYKKVRMEICNGLVYETGIKKIRLDDRKGATVFKEC